MDCNLGAGSSSFKPQIRSWQRDLLSNYFVTNLSILHIYVHFFPEGLWLKHGEACSLRNLLVRCLSLACEVPMPVHRRGSDGLKGCSSRIKGTDASYRRQHSPQPRYPVSYSWDAGLRTHSRNRYEGHTRPLN